jgi:tetratricopeptide (TPR) repeat protein
MGRSPALDATRSTGTIWQLARGFFVRGFAAVLVLASIAGAKANGQSAPGNASLAAQQLFAEERWPEVILAVEGASGRTADLDYYYGNALAKLGRLEEARGAFLAGYRLQPHDKRFAVELGGIEFLSKRYSMAAHWLLIASRNSPGDAYVNDFCGSVFYLQGNLEAALKYWNRVDKPRIESVRSEPVLKVNPVLLDRAFAFAPASTLRLPELLATESRLQGMDLFPTYNFTLSARPDEQFDVTFHAQEPGGWGSSKLEGLLATFRGIFYQTLTPEYDDIRGSDTNALSLLRWDAQKRRAMVSLSGPLQNNPRWRYRVGVDLRNENWAIRESFTGLAPPLASLNLRREAIVANVTSLPGGRWSWSSGAELSHRDFRAVNPGTTLPPGLLLQGYQLKHTAQLKYRVLNLPEKRLTAAATASTETGRIWSQSGDAFFKPQGSLVTHWFPRAQGDDLEMQQQIRAGNIVGAIPFDELFMLGLERDNDLLMRAHIGDRDGRKGSAPLGRRYFLSNWEMDKNVYGNGLITAKLGPFLDTGHITNGTSPLGSQLWLWDAGVQTKLSVLGVKFVLSYGRDLRSGKGAFYVRAVTR